LYRTTTEKQEEVAKKKEGRKEGKEDTLKNFKN